MASRHKTYTPAYRIVSQRYPPFDGSGAHRWGSRWISPGRWVVHAAETYALAVLENLVHWQSSFLPPDLVCVEVRIPNEVKQERLDRIDAPSLLENDYTASRAIGDAWYDRGETAVLWVPSIASPYESNILFNPAAPRLLENRRRRSETSASGSPAPHQSLLMPWTGAGTARN
ncbi:MAG: RES family NAD+ phosphorylase [Woeseiaceae bacterium]